MATSSDRRRLDWGAVRNPQVLLALIVATAGGAGLSPWAPGTMGAVVGIPIAYFTRHWPTGDRLALWAGLLALGTWAAAVFDHAMGSSDNQNIVIDEVVGMGITAWTLVSNDPIQAWLVAFGLFRLFDVWKPFPIRLLDRWSHRLNQRVTGGNPGISWVTGFGVMADDVLAGVYGLVVMILLRHFGFLI